MNLPHRRPALFVAPLVLMAAVAGPGHAAAPAGHYMPSESGKTVYDTKSRLTWMRGVTLGTWAEAKTYCAGAGSVLGGSGWRLPTYKELLTLLDLSQTGSTANDFKLDPVFPYSGMSGTWSATLDAVAPDRAWNVNFFYGDTYPYPIAQQNMVRCVR